MLETTTNGVGLPATFSCLSTIDVHGITIERGNVFSCIKCTFVTLYGIMALLIFNLAMLKA